MIPRIEPACLYVQEFAEVVNRREPVIFRLGSRAGIDEHLHWNTTIWDNIPYLIKVAGKLRIFTLLWLFCR
jgi:hypothetical protein